MDQQQPIEEQIYSFGFTVAAIASPRVDTHTIIILFNTVCRVAVCHELMILELHQRHACRHVALISSQPQEKYSLYNYMRIFHFYVLLHAGRAS
jgi:predicted DCC family thiol-disulfide oxidoreductase YuxK